MQVSKISASLWRPVTLQHACQIISGNNMYVLFSKMPQNLQKAQWIVTRLHLSADNKYSFIIGKTVLCMWFGYFKNKHSSEWFLLWWSMKMTVLQWLGELWIWVTCLCYWLILTLTNTVQYMNICLHNCAFLISFKRILSANISLVNCC